MAMKRRHQDLNFSSSCSASSFGFSAPSGQMLQLPHLVAMNGPEAKSDPFSNSTNLYIRGLLPTDTDESIRRLVSECCPESLSERINSTKAVLDDRTGLCKGYGFVDFLQQSQAAEAMEALLKASPRSGRLQISFARPKEETEKDPTNVYIKNLPTRPECNEDWLTEAIGQELKSGTVTGRIVSCRVMRICLETALASQQSSATSCRTGGSNGATGAGFIRFETERDALAAVSHINRHGVRLAQQLCAARPLEAKLADKTNQRRRQRAAEAAATAAAAAAALAAGMPSSQGIQQGSVALTAAMSQPFPTALSTAMFQQQQPMLQPPPSPVQLNLQQVALANILYGQQQQAQQVVGSRQQPAVVNAPTNYVLAASGLLQAHASPHQLRTNPWTTVGCYDAGTAATAVMYSPTSAQMAPTSQHQQQQYQQSYLQQPPQSSAMFADLNAGITAPSFYQQQQQMIADPSSAAAFQAAAANVYQQQLLAASAVDQQLS